ncbi:MAG: NAD(P)H-dependent oxidoreductase subunit E [Oligoflexia bacterium]|nr:NAD(P)H-dependent oxidoreductase subunit E [Oligoflexia bacterium]
MTQKSELPLKSKTYIQKELKRYEVRESALIPALFEAQKVFGHITPEVIDILAMEMDIPQARISEVANFYTMFNKKPVGKFHIQVCTNISCAMVGARETMDYICEKTGSKPEEISNDGRFTVSAVECLGSCGTAPMAQINDEYHENLTHEKIDKLLEKLK